MVTIKLTEPQWEALKDAIVLADGKIIDCIGEEGYGWDMI